MFRRLITGAPRCRGSEVMAKLRLGSRIADGALEIGAGDPVVAQRLDELAVGVHLALLRGEQLVRAEQHRVVLLLRQAHGLLAHAGRRPWRTAPPRRASPARRPRAARTSERMSTASALSRACACRTWASRRAMTACF